MNECYVGLEGDPRKTFAPKLCWSLRCLYVLILTGFLFLGFCTTVFSQLGSLVLLALDTHLAEQLPFASTSCGSFIGKWERAASVAAFRGIQFGHAQRWLPPEEVCFRFGDKLTAVTDGPACVGRGASHQGQDEHCLYLNIFAPRSSHGSTTTIRANNLPILVYIHGGGLTSGSATSDGHVENLVSLTGEVVVVACQYRLGVLGFMALHELSNRDPRGTSGNYGFLDQQLCLRWIQRHGHAFGGDTSRVTLLGQSSGGTSILAQLMVQGNQGLFHRAISLSASPGAPRMGHIEKEQQDRTLWLPHTGCSNEERILTCLLSRDAGDLASSLPESYGLFGISDYPIQPGPNGRIPWATLSHVDGVTVRAPIDKIHPDRIDVPLLIQSMGAEMSGSSEALPQLRSNELWESFLMQRFSGGFGKRFASDVEHVYEGNSSRELAAYNIDSDTGNFCGLLRIAQAAASTSSSSVYVGVVEAGPGRPLFWCDCSKTVQFPFHGWDLAATTEVWNQLWCACPNYSPTSLDRQFALQQRNRWLALAKYGQLDPSDGWTSLTHQNAYVSILHNGVIRRALPEKRCTFWETHNVSTNWYWVN